VQLQSLSDRALRATRSRPVSCAVSHAAIGIHLHCIVDAVPNLGSTRLRVTVLSRRSFALPPPFLCSRTGGANRKAPAPALSTDCRRTPSLLVYPAACVSIFRCTVIVGPELVGKVQHVEHIKMDYRHQRFKVHGHDHCLFQSTNFLLFLSHIAKPAGPALRSCVQAAGVLSFLFSFRRPFELYNADPKEGRGLGCKEKILRKISVSRQSR
jgi:hypothetical protein